MPTSSGRFLTGKVAIVPGASRRIGRAIALDLARAGAEVSGAVVFLASPAGSLISGHTLVIDGGRIRPLTFPAPAPAHGAEVGAAEGERLSRPARHRP